MVKITVEDQIVNDFKEYFGLADRILKERNPEGGTILEADYLRLLSLVMEHTHWVIETFPPTTEGASTEVIVT